MPKDEIVSLSPAMQQTIQALRDRALDLRPVLLLGERGTGKRRLARWLHQRAARADRPLIVCALAGEPDDILHEVLPQKCKQAEDATLFLSDADELTAGARAQVAHALHANRLHLIVSAVKAPATEDALWPLLGAPIRVPPLRERLEDLDALVHEVAREAGFPEEVLAPSAREVFSAYSWPENVRELKHTLIKLLRAHSGAKLKREQLPANLLRACDPEPSR